MVVVLLLEYFVAGRIDRCRPQQFSCNLTWIPNSSCQHAHASRIASPSHARPPPTCSQQKTIFFRQTKGAGRANWSQKLLPIGQQHCRVIGWLGVCKNVMSDACFIVAVGRFGHGCRRLASANLFGTAGHWWLRTWLIKTLLNAANFWCELIK
jgi:hypothetical protein